MIDVDVEFVHETDMAVLVVNICDEKVWVPKSQINNNFASEFNEKGDTINIEIEQWLAEEKELV